MQLEVPIRLRVSGVSLPRPRLHLGGWDYTDGAGAYDVGAGNQQALIAFLQAHQVDVTWAHRSVLPDPDDFAHRDAPRSKARFAALDAWIARWPAARALFVFLAGKDDFLGSRRGTQEFKGRATSWMADVSRYVKSKKSVEFGVLPVDEPSKPEQGAIVRDWAAVIRPHALVFENPVFADPAAFGDALDACDILCPPWTRYLRLPLEGRTALAPKGNRQLWFYETKGPVRSLDPVAYHRLAAWVAFRAGARGIGFWSFADAGGGSSWNEYLAARGPGFAPEYLDGQSVTLSKHMLAIEEGLEDAERLALLQEKAAGHSLLRDGVKRVLAGVDADPDREVLWSTAKDRSLPDSVADQVLDALESLSR